MVEQINPSVSFLLEKLLLQLKENGYKPANVERSIYMARLLSGYMTQEHQMQYDEATGFAFADEYCQGHPGSHLTSHIRVFIARLNAILNGEAFVVCRKLAEPEVLPSGLEQLLGSYIAHCAEKEYSSGTIALYEKLCRRYLKLLADEGVTDAAGITTVTVSRACLQLTSNYYFSTIHTFLKYLSDAGLLDRDYSRVVPYYKRPQPMPTVYSTEEIQKLEVQTLNHGCGKRDHAMLLLATRLGLRAGDIATMTFDELDFEHEVIHLIQQKTDMPLELPMLPVLREALLDYIQNERGDSDSSYVFLTVTPPYSHVSVQTIGKLVRRVIAETGIEPGNRKQGPHAMRSSLASSMVNDDVPYEVVRRTLGHTDVNAIKSYARLDVEQLRLYTLETPKATGNFAKFLAGGVL